MFNTIIKASENFCMYQMGVLYELCDAIPQMRTVIAYIEIETLSSKKYRVCLGVSLGFAQRVATTLLEEEESDEDTLKDMVLETVNLIVGSAKVLASELNTEAYTIATPHFEKIDYFDFKYDMAKVLKIEEDTMIIAIKEL